MKICCHNKISRKNSSLVQVMTWCPNTRLQWVNSLAPGRFQFKFRYVISKLILVNGGWGISYKITVSWTPLDLTDDKSTLVQVMAWCHLATSHCLSQCWPRSMTPNGVTRPQWVKLVCVPIDTKQNHRTGPLLVQAKPLDIEALTFGNFNQNTKLSSQEKHFDLEKWSAKWAILFGPQAVNTLAPGKL